MTESDLQKKCDQLSWFHSIELAPGITTKGVKSPEILAHEVPLIFGPIKMAGLSVLDIGAWNGFFSFEAKKREARRGLATDDYCWRHPTIRGKEGFDLARSALGLDIEELQIDVLDIGPSLGRFDVVLFLGVFYHLLDPIKALQNIRNVQPRCLIIETHQDALELDRPAMIFYPGTTLAGDPTNWWGPNRLLMYHLLTELGFKQIMYTENVVDHQRGVYHAFLDEGDFFALADPRAQAV
jgi:tRNA (mo5U34)-methyltransferase